MSNILKRGEGFNLIHTLNVLGLRICTVLPQFSVSASDKVLRLIDRRKRFWNPSLDFFFSDVIPQLFALFWNLWYRISPFLLFPKVYWRQIYLAFLHTSHFVFLCMFFLRLERQCIVTSLLFSSCSRRMY